MIRGAVVALLCAIGAYGLDDSWGLGGMNVRANPREIEIVATEYAFTPPAQIRAGRATFRFANKGKVAHELNISRLKPGVSMEEFLDSVRADKSVMNLTDGPVGVLFAGPGTKSAAGLTVNLAAGQRYAIICIFRDNKDAKPHYNLGMTKLITVTDAGAIAGANQKPTDTIVATDYAFTYPRTVKPGRHTFLFRNNGKMRHELNLSLLKKNSTLTEVLAKEKAGGNVDSLFDATDFGLLHARKGVTPFGELTLDMLPGREYLIACYFKDDDKSPEHYKLGMFGSIKVGPK